jgi:PIN domain nuclease of toxin-antitoxin system
VAVVVLDASVVIAFLDANDTHHGTAVEALGTLVASDTVLPASAYAEVLVEPWRRGGLRSQHRGLRLPDALVLATAEGLDAHVLTCDRTWARLRRRVRVV